MKYLPFIYADIKANRKLIIVAEIIFWPLISIASLGLFTKFSNSPFYIKTFLFTGTMGWTIVYLSYYSLARGFMQSVWHNTLKQIFSSPVTLKDMIFGHSLYGIVAATIGFMVISIFTMTVFDFNIFTLGINLLPIVILGCLTGIIIGMIAISFIMLFGLRVDLFVWTIIDVLVFISGLYYSISVFPKVIQIISQLFPVMYVFEGMRMQLSALSPMSIFIKGYIVAFVWLILITLLVRKIETYARRTGFYEKYG